MRAFILAGGFATRLWPLTEKRAKPLLPLAGKPIISYLIEQIPEDIPITVSTNKAFGDDFESWAATLERPNVNVVVEHTKSDDEKLGALGATAQWIKEEGVDEDILLLTGDNYCGFTMKKFLDRYDGASSLIAAHDIGSLEQAQSFGTVIVNGDGTTVTQFEEKPKEPKSTLVNTGCSILPKSVLPILMEYAKVKPDNVGGIFEELLKRSHPVRCFTFGEPWFDIGSFEAYLEATKAIVGDKLHIEPTVIIDETPTAGSVAIGRRSTIRNSNLTNVVIFENCKIDDCVLEDCILDNNCILKGIDLRGKMLREGTKLVRE